MSSYPMPQSPGQDSGYSGSPSKPAPSTCTRASTADRPSSRAAKTADRQAEAELNFWEKQQLKSDSARLFLESTKHVFLCGPDHRIPGVRVDADLASKEEVQDALLQIIEEDLSGSLVSRTLAFRVSTRSCDRRWDNCDAAVGALDRDWPDGMSNTEPHWELTTDLDTSRIEDWTENEERPMVRDWAENVMPFRKSVLLHPGYFIGDWTYFKGAWVSLKGYSFTDLNYPSAEFEETLQPDGGTKKTYAKLNAHFSKLKNVRHGSKLGTTVLCGRSWTICSDGPVMPLNSLLFASSQVTLGHDIEDDRISQVGIMLPKRYAGTWPSTTWTNWCCLGTTMLHAQFHVRYLSVVSAKHDPGPKINYTGLCLERDQAVIDPGPRIKDGRLSIRETRVSIGLLTALWKRKPHFTMVTLADAPRFSIDCLEDQEIWTAMGLEPCDNEFGGVAILQLAVGRLITESVKCWTHTLNQVSRTHTVKLRDIPDYTRYDLAEKERPLEMWQFLNKVRDMIRELGRDLKSLQNDISESLSVIGPRSPVIGANWMALRATYTRAEETLLGIINADLELWGLFAQRSGP